ncbi:aldose 1-epimerase [Noviherbaspirillum sp. CPCC 100848]|uniref:Aldose 1-epimerase n=1 Tax=Noviherbaspirillum album TaxID=3080276 RepID=A0ABU6J6Y4_9BURK|nr:aldose 1-epimerase [Noviherbaspirillum sp. CPCC 100848]MEC4719407.1 aldose 1-epimerase [Noviherbaspirillum sp. CPCC 100848]
MNTDTLTLESDQQRLRLVPEYGGGVIGWDWKLDGQWSPLFRPWNGESEDRYTLSCFPLVPWSNRITGGGFEHEGVFHALRLNRTGESYPIHGDGWLQSWQVSERASDRIKLALESDKFDGNPYHYRSTQTFLLLPDGLQIDLTVTHLGPGSLPYGLGLHPYFMRNAQTRFMARAEGVWLSGDDPIPVEHVTNFPESFDYNTPAPLEGPMIDHCFSGWNGKAVIEYPDRALTLTMVMPDCNGYSLMYRPPGYDFFCFEPITHPIDAFHMPEQPGLAILGHGDSLALRAKFLVSGANLSQS